MNKYLEQLVQLSGINQEIDDFGPKIEKTQKLLKVAIETQNEIEKRVDELSIATKDALVKKSQHELQLAELSDKIKDIAKKSSAIKSEKEQKALSLEEEICKEQCDFSNDEIARLEKVIELKETQIQELKVELETAEAKVAEVQTQIAGELDDINAQRAVVYEKKQQLVAQMSQKILTFYEKIRKWAGNTAVVQVKKQACYGCFMKINDKTYSSVIRGAVLILLA